MSTVSNASMSILALSFLAGSQPGSPCTNSSSTHVSVCSNVSSPQSFSTTILHGPQARPTRNIHRRWRWCCRQVRSRAGRAGITRVIRPTRHVAYRCSFRPFPVLLPPQASGGGPSATLTLLAAVGCASLARSRAIKKRARHDLRGGTGTADGGVHNS